MKLIALFLALIFTSTTFAGAPLGVSGQQATSNFYPSVIQAPNNQVTDIGAGKGLFEHGNKNILVNPSFEHKTLGSGWTSSGTGTSSSESTIVIDGKKSYKVVMSAQTLNLSQSSTLYAAQFNGTVQGLAMVRAKSNVALSVCAIQAGVVSTTLCVTTATDNNWGLYKIPFILSATSNGISIVSASATGTAYIDDAFVGAVDLKTDGTGIDTQYSFISQTATFGAATITGTPSATSGSGIFSYNSSTGTYTVLRAGSVSVSASFAAAGAAATQPTISYNGTTVAWANSIAVSGGLSEASWEGPTVVGDTFYVTNLGGNSTSSQKIAVSAKSFSKLSTYSSANADTDWASCGHTTSSFVGFGTVSGVETSCKRQGSDLLMKGKFTSGTSTFTEARIPLPVWNGVQLVSKNSATIPSTQIAGDGFFNAGTATTITVLIDPSVSYINLGLQAGATAGLTKQPASSVLSSGQQMSFVARIPIEGWENSNVIIAKISGLESCTDTNTCTVEYTAQGTTTSGAVTAGSENVDFINGNCTAANPTVCTFNTGIFTVAPNCSATLSSNSAVVLGVASTSTTVTIRSILSTTGADQPSIPFTLKCSKTGADYVGKTGMAVASDQNLRTPGVTKAVVYSATIDTTGATSIEVGDFINGACTNASPNVCTFNSNVWTSAPVCSATYSANANCACRINAVSTSSVSVDCKTLGSSILDCAVSTVKSISCHGISP